MIAFIDDHREAYGVEPICRVLPIAPSTYHEHVAQRRDQRRLSAGAQRDRDLKPEIARVLEPIGNIPPAEAEEQYSAAADIVDMAA